MDNLNKVISILLVIVLSMFIETITLTAQISYIRNNCCATLKADTGFSNEYTHLIDYVTQELIDSNEVIYSISIRDSMPEIPVYYCNDTLYYAEMQDRKTSIYIHQETVAKTELSYTYWNYGADSVLTKINGKHPYGGTYGAKRLGRIDSINIKFKGNPISIPDKAFNDLFFPNFCITNGIMRPIATYYTGDYLYIYIFGKSEFNFRENPHPPISFMAKLIVHKSGYKGRIVLDTGTIMSYLKDCEKFIGF